MCRSITPNGSRAVSASHVIFPLMSHFEYIRVVITVEPVELHQGANDDNTEF